MTSEALLAHCLAKPGAWQDEPWEGGTVAKVGDKIFAFEETLEAVDASYDTVVATLPKSRWPSAGADT